jgi:hypothetical protein
MHAADLLNLGVINSRPSILLEGFEYATDANAQAAYVNDGSFGSEMVLNGIDWTGASGTTPPNNWTKHASSTDDTFNIGSGVLNAANIGFVALIYQEITVVVGKTYIVSVDLKAGIASTYGMICKFGTTVDGGEYAIFNEVRTDILYNHTAIFTATTSTLFVEIFPAVDTSNQSGSVDNVSVKLVPVLSYSESTIKTQGSYSLKVVAAQTDSLNKTLIHTFDPPLDLSGKNSFSLDMRASRTGANVKLGLHDTGGTTTELTPTIITAGVYQKVNVDLRAVADADKNAIDKLIFTPVNADAANTIYFDNGKCK